MICEELLKRLVEYQVLQKRNPDVLRLNPDYYRTLLEQLAYPEWLIEKQMSMSDKKLLGIHVEITDEVEKFELPELN
ncbi:hypothetical protein [Bacillus sp. C1]